MGRNPTAPTHGPASALSSPTTIAHFSLACSSLGNSLLSWLGPGPRAQGTPILDGVMYTGPTEDDHFIWDGFPEVVSPDRTSGRMRIPTGVSVFYSLSIVLSLVLLNSGIIPQYKPHACGFSDSYPVSVPILARGPSMYLRPPTRQIPWVGSSCVQC